MPTAAHVAGWNRIWGKRGKWALSAPLVAGSPPIQGPQDPIGLKVEIYLGSLGWTDISSYVYYRNNVGVTITRGRPDETSQVQPQTATLILNNRGGTFTPRLATGPYYGLIGRNTPLRVSRTWNGVQIFRFHGEVTAWPTTSDISGRDVYESITAAGMLRRLSQGNRPIGSAMYRAYAISSPSTLVAYWPCEDGAHATSLASGLPGQTPMQISGTPTLANNTDFVCSDPLPLLSGSTWTGVVPSYTQPTPSFEVGNVLRFLLSVPATGAYDTAVIARMLTTGTITRVDLIYGNVGQLRLVGYNGIGTQVFDSGLTAFGITGQKIRVDIQLRTNGTAVNWFLGVGLTLGPVFTNGTVSSASVGQVTQVKINPDGHINDTALGHVSVQSNWQVLVSDLIPLTGWLGEPPCSGANITPQLNVVDTDRFSRLCREQNVPAVVIVSPAGYDTDDANSSGVVWSGVGPNPVNPSMGYQLTDGFANLIGEAVSTEQGLLFEARDQISLVMRSRKSLYNQAARLTLDHSQHQLSAPLNPVDDDRLTRNDITVTRKNGSSYQLVQTTGTLSIQPAPAGVGDYATSYSLSLGDDSLLPDQAGWLLHLGTVDEPRYPSISLNLRHPSITSDVDLMNAALALDIGDRVVITNPPPELPPDQISLIGQGYTERLGIFEHDMVLNCSPESPYRIAITDDPILGDADTDGSTLGAPLGAADTAISLVTTNASSPVWTTSHQDTPFDVNVGGERITLAVAGTLLNSNPFFATDISGWAALGAGATVSWSTDFLAPGASGSLKVMPPGGVATIDAHDVLTGVGTVTPSQTYVVMAWVYSPNGWSDLRVCVDWYNSSGVFVSSGLGSASVVPAGAWTFLTQTLTAPASSSQALLRVRQGSTPAATDVFYCWAVRMVPSASVSTSSPQTFTGIRSVNGLVKAQTAGTDVRLWQPAYASL